VSSSEITTRWRTAALASAALLVVPLVVWLVLPSPPPVSAPTPAPRAPAPPVEDERPRSPSARPAPPAPTDVARSVAPPHDEDGGVEVKTGIAGHVVDAAGAPVMTFSIGVASFKAAGGVDGGAGGAARRDVDDAEGAFELTDLAPGRYELVVSPMAGAFTRSQAIDVTPGAMTRGVRVVVQPGVTVTGTVTDAATGAPLDGARASVQVNGISTRRPFTRGGEFTLHDVPVDRFELLVTCPGYMPKVVPDLQGRPGGPPLRVEVALERLSPP